MSRFTDRQTTDTVAAAQQGTGAATGVEPVMLDQLFIGLIRSPRFFMEARRLINPNQFHPMTEQHYRLLWNVLCYMRDGFGEFRREDLYAECHRQLYANPTSVLPQHQERLLRTDQYGLVYWSFAVADVNLQYCRHLLREFLQERTVANPLRNFMDSVSQGQYPSNIDDFLDTVDRQRERIRGMQQVPRVETVPSLSQELEPSATMTTTGVPWIDGPLRGQAEGDANGIIGVTGSGKSTMAAYMATATAERAWLEAMARNQMPQGVALFTYEESARRTMPRVWSSALKIRRSKLMTMRHPSLELTTRANMEEYERRLQPQSGEQLAEQDRWELGRVWLNKTLSVFDMSGSAEFPYAGSGYIPEIVATMDTHCQETGMGWRSIFIDYAGLVARRFMNMNDIPDERLRSFLAKFGDDCRREIAEKFKCTVWIMHQVAAQEGNRNPTSLIHHSMASESKAFAENLAVCGCIGPPDQATGCRMLNWSKVRHTRGQEVPPVTLRINDEFAIMEDVGNRYVINESGRSFVTRDVRERIHGPNTAQPAPAAIGHAAGDVADGSTPYARAES